MSTGPIDFGTSFTPPARPPTQEERDQLLSAIGGLKNRSEWFQIVYPGDDIFELYGALTEAEGLTASNRGTFLMMPGVYELPGIWELQSNIDVIGVGTVDKKPSVVIVDNEGTTGVVVRGNDVLVKGINSNILRIAAHLTGVEFEDCVAGDFGFSFLSSGIDVAPYNAESYIVDYADFVNVEALTLEDCSFTRCLAGSYSFGPVLTSCRLKDCRAGSNCFGAVGILDGSVLEDCVGESFCFGCPQVSDLSWLYFPYEVDSTIRNSTFRNCTSESYFAFGYNIVENSSFYNCRGSDVSFNGNVSFTDNVLEDCVAGGYSFSADAPAIGCTFRRCTATDLSFCCEDLLTVGISGNAVTVFEDCVSGALSFANGMIPVLLPGGEFPYKFVRCVGGAESFGASMGCFGEFIDCIGGPGSFGGSSWCVGRFIGCRIGTATSRFSQSVFTSSSFGMYGGLYGYFENCDIPILNSLSKNLTALEVIPPELLTFEAVNCLLYNPDITAVHAVSGSVDIPISIRDSVLYFNYAEGGANLAAVVTALTNRPSGPANPDVGVYNCYAVVSSGASATNPDSMKIPPSLLSIPTSE